MPVDFHPFLRGKGAALFIPGRGMDALIPGQSIFFPGSFNPLHQGHSKLLSAAERLSGRKGVLELSVENVDKPRLDECALRERLEFIDGAWPVVLTRAPRFLEKAALFPQGHFLMGVDTVARLLSSRYHDDVPAMLRQFCAHQICFWVGGRLQGHHFLTLADLRVPRGFESLFQAIPEEIFRVDVSSTAIRNRLQDGPR